mmetsp:Transcript_68039/g.134880  ORF Transcript_68039/g.134880 Transcript_68039/m.134880 type:complete len:81 (+) Transcript_68039:175-417(+)
MHERSRADRPTRKAERVQRRAGKLATSYLACILRAKHREGGSGCAVWTGCSTKQAAAQESSRVQGVECIVADRSMGCGAT